MSNNFKINDTQHKKLVALCIECDNSTNHTVLTSIHRSGDDRDGEYSIYWKMDYEIIQCMGCESISFRIESFNSEDDCCFNAEGDAEEYKPKETLYPPRTMGIKSLEKAYFLPHSIKEIYDETTAALLNSSPILAGIGLRTILEAICVMCMDKKDEKDEKDCRWTLEKKINKLVEMKILTSDRANVLHNIRLLGNDAAHETKAHNNKKLHLAMNVIKHLLYEVYILPEESSLTFKDSTKKP